MGWRLLQIVVFLGVAFTGIYYEWTPNGLALGIIAWLAAFAATVFLGDLLRLLRWLKSRAFRTHQRKNDRLLRRRKVPDTLGH
jgi:hypothetical protein